MLGEFLSFNGERSRITVNKLPAHQCRPVRSDRPGAGLILQQSEVTVHFFAVGRKVAIVLLSVRDTPQTICRAFMACFTSRKTSESPQALEGLHGFATLSQARCARKKLPIRFRIGERGAQHREVA